MGRSKKSLDRLIQRYKHKDLPFKLTRVPVLKSLGRRVMSTDNDTLTYIPIYADLELPEGTVVPVSIIEHFINEASHHLILSRCPCRSGNGCREFDPYFGCTFLGPAVTEVDPEVGRLVSREEALRHLHEATEAGLVSCLGKWKGDAMILGLKDHHHLMTICHCCPCCCISTSLHYASKEFRDLLVKLEGVNVEITEGCNGCGRCVDNCVFKQITLEDGVAVIGDECKGCGRCAMVCKRGAVRVSIDEPRYIDECIERISCRVDVGQGALS